MSRRPLRLATWGAAVGVITLVFAGTAPLLLGSSGASAAVTPGVEPDIVLSPNSRVFHKQVSSLLVNDLTPQADPTVVPTADQCRDLPPLDIYCDVYRIKVVRDTRPGASNFVQMSFSWDSQGKTPALVLVAAGLSDSDVPDLDLFLYKNADTYEDLGSFGRSALIPERIAWEATQDEYDLVVRAGLGVATSYSVDARLSAELFDPQFETLEQLTEGGVPPGTPADYKTGHGGGETAGVANSLALLPVGADDQIAGIGLGATERFDPAQFDLGSNTRALAALTKPPSGLKLFVAMLLLPAAGAAAAVILLRRRRDAYYS